MVVNIKSARVLNPQNNLQEQLKIAKFDVNSIQGGQPNQQLTRLQQPQPNSNLHRIEYHQIFRSPWCCDLGDEHQYKTMMESIINLNMDEVENILMVCAAMFDVSGKKTRVIYFPKNSLLVRVRQFSKNHTNKGKGV